MAFVNAIVSFVKSALKTVATAALVVVVASLVWSGTYGSFKNGKYLDAALGAIILLAMAAAVLWTVYKRVDLDALPTSSGFVSDYI